MGAYLKAVVGRIRPGVTNSVEEGSGTELALFDSKRFQLENFEFSSDLPADLSIWQDYDLCSFLAGVRGNLRPIVPLGELKKATTQFLQWANSEHRKQDGGDQGWPGLSEIDDLFGSYGIYNVGDGGRVFYPLQMLRDFDYDQVAVVKDSKSTGNTPAYFRAEDERTYRREIGHQYFSFLEWCAENNWQFVIFGIDG